MSKGKVSSFLFGAFLALVLILLREVLPGRYESFIIRGILGVYILTGGIIWRKRTGTIYFPLGDIILSLVCFLTCIQKLVNPQKEWHYLMWIGIGFFFLMWWMEKKKNPDIMKKWNEKADKSSFLDILLLRNFPRIIEDTSGENRAIKKE